MSRRDKSEETPPPAESTGGAKVREDAAEAPSPKPNWDKGGTYVVAEGRSLNAPRVGTLGEGQAVTVEMFDGDQETLDRLVKQGTVEKR